MTDRFGAIWRYPCGGVSALIGKVTCGITCSGLRWCECGCVILGNTEACEHLAMLAAATAGDTR